MVEEWAIIFTRARGDTLWTRFLSRPWQHVLAIGRDRNGGWIEVNPAFNMVRVHALPGEDAEHCLRIARRMRWTVLRIPQRDTGPHRPRLGVLTCAGVIAHVIGLRQTAWTPRALYRHLIAAGAVLAGEGADGQSVQGPEDFRPGDHACHAGGERAGCAGAG